MSRMPLVPREPAVTAVGSDAAAPASGSAPMAGSRRASAALSAAPSAPSVAPSAAPDRLPEAGPSVVSPTGPADTRDRISAAAFELFAAQGYDSTTVDAVAERAGIARRTFFRYFRSKDDVIFPDHDHLLAKVQQELDLAAQLSPVAAICGGVRLVFRSYVDDPQVSVQRYRLTRSVSALRDRELASVRRYDRMFSKYVRQRLAGESGAMLRGDVIAATVVAAHNAVLREWLRAGGDYDPMDDLEQAFGWVTRTFEPAIPADGDVEPARDAGSGEAEDAAGETQTNGANDVVVAVFRADRPLNDVLERISRSL